MANFIIFKDEGGVGVQLGDEKQYITDDIAQTIGQDIATLKAEIRALDSDNRNLRDKIESSKEMRIKYDIIQSLVAESGY
jgi:hypothetical protein